MPDRFGMDHLVRRGEVTLRCIWCPHTPKLGASEKSLECHARTHRVEALEAQEASRREREMTVEVLKV